MQEINKNNTEKVNPNESALIKKEALYLDSSGNDTLLSCIAKKITEIINTTRQSVTIKVSSWLDIAAAIEQGILEKIHENESISLKVTFTLGKNTVTSNIDLNKEHAKKLATSQTETKIDLLVNLIQTSCNQEDKNKIKITKVEITTNE